MEPVWLSLWVSKLAACFLPAAVELFAGVVSPGVRHYTRLLSAVEQPVSFVLWMTVVQFAFPVVSDFRVARGSLISSGPARSARRREADQPAEMDIKCEIDPPSPLDMHLLRTRRAHFHPASEHQLPPEAIPTQGERSEAKDPSPQLAVRRIDRTLSRPLRRVRGTGSRYSVTSTSRCFSDDFLVSKWNPDESPASGRSLQ